MGGSLLEAPVNGRDATGRASDVGGAVSSAIKSMHVPRESAFRKGVQYLGAESKRARIAPRAGPLAVASEGAPDESHLPYSEEGATKTLKRPACATHGSSNSRRQSQDQTSDSILNSLTAVCPPKRTARSSSNIKQVSTPARVAANLSKVAPVLVQPAWQACLRASPRRIAAKTSRLPRHSRVAITKLPR